MKKNKNDLTNDSNIPKTNNKSNEKIHKELLKDMDKRIFKKDIDGNKIYDSVKIIYGVIPHHLAIPLAMFVNKSDAEEYAKIFIGSAKKLNGYAYLKGRPDYIIEEYKFPILLPLSSEQ